MRPAQNPAAKGTLSHHEQCRGAEGLEQRALYGPTGFMEFVGPVGTGTLHPHATDKAVMGRLWDLSEQAVGFEWDLISEPIA